MSTPNEPPLTQLGRALYETEELRATVEHLTATINTERSTRFRFRLNMGGLALLMVMGIVIVSFTYQAANDAKQVGNTLEDCLVAGGGCYEKLARNGLLGSNRLMDFNACFFLIPPLDRNEADTARCREQADARFFKALEATQK